MEFPDLSRVYAVSKCYQLLKSITNLFTEEDVKKTLSIVESLMAIHNITMQEINAPTEGDFEKWTELLKTRYGYWNSRAIHIVTRYYLVRVTYQNYQIDFFGLPANIFIAKEVYRSLLFSFDALWKEHRQIQRYYGRLDLKRKIFIDGLATRIEERLDEVFNNKIDIPVMKTSSTGSEIVTEAKILRNLINPSKKMLDMFFEEATPNVKAVSWGLKNKITIDDQMDFDAGYKRGNDLKLPFLFDRHSK